MNRKIVITGATGLIGEKIYGKLKNLGDEIIVVTRSVEKAKLLLPGAAGYIDWSSESKILKNIAEGCDAVIHLAGENIGVKRWSKKRKKKIYESRIITSKKLIEIIASVSIKPKVVISASGINYYGSSETAVDESSPKGKGFLADVVKDWENEIIKVSQFGVRSVIIRMGMVLDKNNGALPIIVLPYKFFVGGPIGSGRQWMSWIHIEDAVNIFINAIDDGKFMGIINCVSPDTLRMNDFSKILARELKRPVIFRVPSFLIKIILGEASQLVLDGARVVPRRLLDLDYKFRFDTLNKALENIYKS